MKSLICLFAIIGSTSLFAAGCKSNASVENEVKGPVLEQADAAVGTETTTPSVKTDLDAGVVADDAGEPVKPAAAK